MTQPSDRREDSAAPATGERDEPSGPGVTIRPWRVGAVTLVLCALFGGVIARAHHLQVGRSDDLTREAEAQLSGGVEIQARRGAIYDREGREMAVSVQAESIFVRPPQVTAPREAAAALAQHLGLSEIALFESLTSDRNFVWLSRRIAPQIAAQLRALDLPGVDSTPEWQRYYPMRQRAGHLLGFTGDEGYGLEGIERTLDERLAGGAMEVRGLRDALGRPVLAMEGPELEAMEGASVVLTIDSRIQRIAERELERAVLEEEARTGVAVVVDPHTGEVLAMTSWPLFDPNRFRSLTPSQWRNLAVTDAWEPGSTMKVFTYAAALEADLLEPDDLLDTGGGSIRIGRHRIRDHVNQDRMAAWEIIQKSSNIGAYRMGALLGDAGLYEAFRRFGFGEPTGIGLGGEQSGLLAEPPWAEVELANRAFGQGVSATPLQMAMGFSAIANGGELMAPMIVREIRNNNDEVIERFEPRVVRRVISSTTAGQVTFAMTRVTDPAGTGTQARIPGIAVAGKTGTAQMVNPETGLYDDLWMASFIGFVPADDPIFTVVVMIDQPQVGLYGGEVAGPVFERIAEQALATRGIYAAVDETRAVAAADERPAGEVSPEPDAGLPPMLAMSALPVGYDGRPARVTLPDLTGRQLGDVIALSESLGLDMDVIGWGAVERQWPAPGASVLQGSVVEVYLSAPYQRGQISGAQTVESPARSAEAEIR